MNRTIWHTYNALRRYHGIGAQHALRMAKARYALEYDYNGVVAFQEPEQESTRDVYGDVCPKGTRCRDSKCKYAHYDPDATMLYIGWGTESTRFLGVFDGRVRREVLASVGMVEDDGWNGERSHNWYMECELATEALDVLQSSELECESV